MCIFCEKTTGSVAILLLCIFISSCASRKLFLNPSVDAIQPEVTIRPDYTIYAIGDAGELNDQSRAVMKHIALVASDDTQPGVILFLGDNIYPSGFPPEGMIRETQRAQDILMNQVIPVKDYAGDNHQIIFLPGNHDWNEFKPGGLDAIRRQSAFIEALGPDYHFLPEAGCSGPEEYSTGTENVVLIIIDSQWWLQDWDKEPMMNQNCPFKSREDFITSLQSVIKAHNGSQVVIAMHHPLMTQGPHAG
ncbi:MAG: metallophosphoesterase, partial [Saprospiraceae bacterium]